MGASALESMVTAVQKLHGSSLAVVFDGLEILSEIVGKEPLLKLLSTLSRDDENKG